MSISQSPRSSVSANAEGASAKSNFWQSFSFQEYENEITAYFSERSPNAVYQSHSERLKTRFENACMQVKIFVLLKNEV